MKLQQGQLWKQGETYYRIVHWARMAIEYKAMRSPTAVEGERHQVTKKEFCRLIKGAELLEAEPGLQGGGKEVPAASGGVTEPRKRG